MTIRLMLVDDHQLVRDGLRVRLEAVPGFQVVGEASNAEETHSLLETLRPTLVLMDVGMKGTNGIELASALLKRDPSLHILMLSMYDNAEYVHRAMQAGARGYVLKDSPASEIIAAIEAIASGGTFLSPAVSKLLFRDREERAMFSAREQQILSALARGLPSKLIAREMDVSVRTVEAHRQSIRRKLNLEGQAELIKYAVEHARDTKDGLENQ